MTVTFSPAFAYATASTLPDEPGDDDEMPDAVPPETGKDTAETTEPAEAEEVDETEVCPGTVDQEHCYHHLLEGGVTCCFCGEIYQTETEHGPYVVTPPIFLAPKILKLKVYLTAIYKHAIERAGWNVAEAAHRLDMAPSSLALATRKYGIQRPVDEQGQPVKGARRRRKKKARG